MRLVFRADSSLDLGAGHIMRCLTLAERLKEGGAAVAFICRDLPGNLMGFMQSRSFEVRSLPIPAAGSSRDRGSHKYAAWLGVDWQEDAAQTAALLERGPEPVDWLIIDHYALDRGWQLRLRPRVRKIMVIDDLANRPHDCDLLLDQNYFANLEHRYDGLAPPHCVTLLGPRYALLRPEFLQARRDLRQRDGKVRRIMIAFGGSDPSNETTKALEAVSRLNRSDIAVDVVVGAANPHRASIEALCTRLPGARLHCQVSYMARLMTEADLAIGAGGTSTWERCCLGLPTLTISIAANQEETTRDLAGAGVSWYLGPKQRVSGDDIYAALVTLMADAGPLASMGERCAALVDGQGAGRVVSTMLF
jgi:UDP-2,4-diacetamido-2,4,6-trideoxy-beta-L-altropyranose hydrolase